MLRTISPNSESHLSPAVNIQVSNAARVHVSPSLVNVPAARDTASLLLWEPSTVPGKTSGSVKSVHCPKVCVKMNPGFIFCLCYLQSSEDFV